MSEDECQAALEKSMVLFSVLNEKDTYEAFYKKYLARRLLYGKSANTETERSMISRLKVECGANYTAKLEGDNTCSHKSIDRLTSFSRHVYRHGHIQRCHDGVLELLGRESEGRS